MVNPRLVRVASGVLAFSLGFFVAVTTPGCGLIWGCRCDGEPRPLEEATFEQGCSVRSQGADGRATDLPFDLVEPTIRTAPGSLAIEYAVDGDTFSARYLRWP